MYVIIKHVRVQDEKIFPVIMLDSHGEVLEFDKKEDSDQLAKILNVNTDSGHRYEVKKV